MLLKRVGVCVLTFLVFMSGASQAQEAGVNSELAPLKPMMDFDQSFRVVGQTDAESDSICIGKMISPLCAVETYLAAETREDLHLQDIATGQINPAERRPFQPKLKVKRGYRVISVRQYPPHLVPAPRYNEYDIQPWDVAVYMETCNATYELCKSGAPNEDEGSLVRRGEYGWYVVPGVGFRMDPTDPNQVSSKNWK